MIIGRIRCVLGIVGFAGVASAQYGLFRLWQLEPIPPTADMLPWTLGDYLSFAPWFIGMLALYVSVASFLSMVRFHGPWRETSIGALVLCAASIGIGLIASWLRQGSPATAGSVAELWPYALITLGYVVAMTIAFLDVILPPWSTPKDRVNAN